MWFDWMLFEDPPRIPPRCGRKKASCWTGFGKFRWCDQFGFGVVWTTFSIQGEVLYVEMPRLGW